MNKTIIRAKIGKNGDVTILDVQGAGKNCVALTAEYESKVGVANENTREATSNMYQEVDPLKLENHLN
jgi:hypothetical protein